MGAARGGWRLHRPALQHTRAHRDAQGPGRGRCAQQPRPRFRPEPPIRERRIHEQAAPARRPAARAAQGQGHSSGNRGADQHAPEAHRVRGEEGLPAHGYRRHLPPRPSPRPHTEEMRRRAGDQPPAAPHRPRRRARETARATVLSTLDRGAARPRRAAAQRRRDRRRRRRHGTVQCSKTNADGQRPPIRRRQAATTPEPGDPVVGRGADQMHGGHVGLAIEFTARGPATHAVQLAGAGGARPGSAASLAEEARRSPSDRVTWRRRGSAASSSPSIPSIREPPAGNGTDEDTDELVRPLDPPPSR